ncbi:MAG: hypothetical protein AB8E82_14155 [Aureispira sp.]
MRHSWIIIPFLFLILPFWSSCNDNYKKVAETPEATNHDLELVVYEASTRGRFLRIEVRSQGIEVYTAHGVTDPIQQEITPQEWKVIVEAVEAIDLNTISSLAAPSSDHSRDAALSARVQIVHQKGTFDSSTFDHKNPPVALKKLTDQLLSITEGID